MRFSLLPLIILAWVALADGAAAQGLNTQYAFTTLTNLLARDPRSIAKEGRATVTISGVESVGSWGPPRVLRYDETSTATADNGCVWEPANGIGRWIAEDCEGAALDPRWFGAIADDLLDDSAALQATIDAAGARSAVRLPVGRFLLSTPLSYKDRIHIKGEGDGSMLAVTATNGIAFWNGTPGTRIYEVFLENFAVNTALGARGYAAITLTNVSYARLEKLTIHAYDGKGFQFGVKPHGDSPASVGGAWSSSMVGCRVYVYAWPGQPAYAFYGSGGPEWGHGPNSWRIVDNYLNCQPNSVFGGGGTNQGTAILFAQNQNGIQISKNIFEGYYTNAVILDTGAASTIDGNRFEVSYGVGGTNFAAIRMNNMTNVFIAGNMSQGLGDYTKYIRASSSSSYSVFDAASGSPNTIDGDLLIGRSWSVDDTGYLPYVTNYAIVGSKRNPEKLGMGLRTIDGTVNPRAIMTLNAEPGATDSWAGIFHGSSLATVPFYFYASRTNLAITDSGLGVLGLPTVSAALSVYGNGAFGSDPSVAGGWTDMNEGIWVRTTDLADRAGFHAIVNDGVTNRRIEMMVSKTNAAIRTTATTDNLPLDFWVAGKQPLSLESSSIKVKTNLIFQGASSLYIGGDTITDFTGAGLSVVGGVLTATGSGGGTNSWKIEVNTTEVLEPDLTDTATVGWNVVGTGVSASIQNGSIQTNHIDPTFHALLTGGSGDVVGPASSVDGDIVAFDGTTGKLIKTAGIAATNVLTKTAATNTYQLADADLTDLADGTLTGSKIGAGIDDDNVTFDDGDGLWTATAIGPALEELNDSINAGVPNGTGAKLHWSQLLGVPAGFADGTDDGAGGGVGDVVGPASSVDGDIVAFDGTTGKLIKTSGIALTNVLTKTDATNTYQLADADLADLADGALTGSKVGSGIDDDNVTFDDGDGLWTSTAIGPALEELNDSINAGAPNGTGAKLHWSQLLGVPAGFADGTDDGAGGGTGDVVSTADNVLSGVNQFTNASGQVFSVPPRVLGGRINSWTAPQMTPGTNAAIQAQYKVLGDGIPSVEFDGATSEEISMVGLLSQDPDRGAFVTLTFASDDTANTVCWQAQWQLLTLRGIDTNLLSTAATWTSNIPGTARVPTNITFSLNAPTGLVGSTNDFSKPYMLRISRLPGSDSSLSNAYLIGVDHRYGLQ